MLRCVALRCAWSVGRMLSCASLFWAERLARDSCERTDAEMTGLEDESSNPVGPAVAAHGIIPIRRRAVYIQADSLWRSSLSHNVCYALLLLVLVMLLLCDSPSWRPLHCYPQPGSRTQRNCSRRNSPPRVESPDCCNCSRNRCVPCGLSPRSNHWPVPSMLVDATRPHLTLPARYDLSSIDRQSSVSLHSRHASRATNPQSHTCTCFVHLPGLC